MKKVNKDTFIKQSTAILEGIYEHLAGLGDVALDGLNPKKTALVVVDMINGFAREGALKSPRVEGIIAGIEAIAKACDKLGIQRLAFADSHTDASPEFSSYPPHCMKGTSEEELVEELKNLGGWLLIPKNSTNGFLEPAFQEWLARNEAIDTFIVTGDCTDICIQQFAITLKTWFNRQNRKSRIIVPADAVDTFDLGLHSGDLMHVMALFNMIGNGVEVVARIHA
jgi:nicotinamidase-related amidase